MKRSLTIGYGAVCDVVFLAAFLYAIGFVGNLVVPRSVDSGVSAPIGEAVIVNVLLRTRVGGLIPHLHRHGGPAAPDATVRPA